MNRDNAGFKEGDIVQKKGMRRRRYTRERWKVIDIVRRPGIKPLLELELIDTGEGPPKHRKTCLLDASWCRKAERNNARSDEP